jgi:hypothetical protein
MFRRTFAESLPLIDVDQRKPIPMSDEPTWIKYVQKLSIVA